MLFFTIFLVAMFTAIILIPPLTYLYSKLNLVDIPSARKVHTVPIPRVGGVAIVIATVIPIVVWMQFDSALIGMLTGVLMLFVLGIIDDAKSLSYKSKFIVQILAIFLVFYAGFINIQSSYYVSNELVSDLVLSALYFIFILGVTNAINLADGLDGLAGGEALLSFSIIGLLAYEINNFNVVLIVLAIIGSVFGFLRFNTYPAKIFMGDTGSLFLGFILGVLSIALTYSEANAFAKTLPLLLVGLPIFDTLMVMFIRLSNKQSPFNADRNHLHHKLLDNGYKHYQSVLIIYLIQSVYIVTAYFMRYETDFNVVMAFIIISAVAFLIGSSHKKSDVSFFISGKFKNIFYLTRNTVTKYSHQLFILLGITLFISAGLSIVNIDTSELDIIILMSVITILAVAGLVFFVNKPCNWFERVAIHIMIVLSIYFSAQSDTSSLVKNIHLLLLVFSVGIVAVLFMDNGSKRFVGSPLDFLLIATAIVIPNLPRSPIAEPFLSVLIIKLIILFYCIEYILFNIKQHWWIVRITLAFSASVPVMISFL